MRIIQGILKRSSKRAYLAMYDANGILRIVRLTGMPPCQSGNTVTLHGDFSSGVFQVKSARPHRFPRLLEAG
ncbi:MAG TPA: hypothetical protein PKE49_13860 [Leptospiraceae bacterium]|jgi:hypothetical protein|nr:hypothetical protein [Leptospirales bacterium]HMU84271.1 hypothetical protein [Leptospiraceae bacterium]HMW58273.1 hypothetical protein [Leptospiraceae bacterium]HMX57606.1 hypothetical protein [Leptospiraceae bacterium]HMY45243.1 hypothetical protein [Leptospiraceae bacterium]